MYQNPQYQQPFFRDDYESTIRQRRHSYPSHFEDTAQYNDFANQGDFEKAKIRLTSRICSVSKYIIVITILLGALILYILYNYSFDSIGSRVRSVDGKTIRREPLDLGPLDIEKSMLDSRKRNWDDYERNGGCRCVLNGIESSPGLYDILTIAPIHIIESHYKEFTFKERDIIVRHTSIAKETRGSSATFVVPQIYMANAKEQQHSSFPCFMSLFTSDGKTDKVANVIHMINPVIGSESDGEGLAAHVSIDVIASLNTPFVMTIPEELYVTYETVSNIDGKLKRNEMTLRDPVNIINMINGWHLMHASLYSGWNFKANE